MRTLKAILALVAIFGAISVAPSALAQIAKAGQHNHATKTAKQTLYVCEHCKVATSRKGSCPSCKLALKATKATVAYTCASCNVSKSAAGKCPSCGSKLQKVAVTYACDHCHTTSAKAGNCPTCKMAMTKKTILFGKS